MNSNVLEEEDSCQERPCPSCPDGQVWNSNGPTGKTCNTCNGHASVKFDGSPVGPRFGANTKSQGWLSNEQAHDLRAKLKRAERDLAVAFASIERFREWRASIFAVVNSKDSIK